MDHTHHGEHSPTKTTSASHSMSMTINWNYETVIVFDFFRTSTPSGLFIACLCVSGFCYGFEAFRHHRSNYDRVLVEMIQKERNSLMGGIDMEDDLKSRPAKKSEQYYQLIRAGLHGIEVTVGFLIMLITMSMNAFLFLSIVAGSSAGFYVYQKVL
ncbi:hypothetical protein SmJEL517_g01509 [Synchytrium microbalum]|uniref:Copper transport protein n=1 Tax=Synchytrium microbalum TaxID=1806994 RepID=A0A507C5E2_9FUNG|nr:uncharacterized protein SmJEL517_g01509 [Synchytrium microbalum]TPX36207.1 hypothetical protein SmJEL517_g01509 [Synchytrium microbalum]